MPAHGQVAEAMGLAELSARSTDGLSVQCCPSAARNTDHYIIYMFYIYFFILYIYTHRIYIYIYIGFIG